MREKKLFKGIELARVCLVSDEINGEDYYLRYDHDNKPHLYKLPSPGSQKKLLKLTT